MDRDESVRAFLQHIRRELKAHDIALRLSHKNADHQQFTGWFDNIAKELVVFRGQPQWLETLVHEFSHFLQYKDGHELFLRTSDRGQFWLQECALRGDPGPGQEAAVCKIVHGLSHSKRRNVVERVLEDVQLLELDVAPRGMALAERFRLPINKRLYVACALRNVQQWRFEVEGQHPILPKSNLPMTRADLDKRTISTFGTDFGHFDYKTVTDPQRAYFLELYS